MYVLWSLSSTITMPVSPLMPFFFSSSLGSYRVPSLPWHQSQSIKYGLRNCLSIDVCIRIHVTITAITKKTKDHANHSRKPSIQYPCDFREPRCLCRLVERPEMVSFDRCTPKPSIGGDETLPVLHVVFFHSPIRRAPESVHRKFEWRNTCMASMVFPLLSCWLHLFLSFLFPTSIH